MMAVSSFARAFQLFQCRSDSDFSFPLIPSAGYGGHSAKSKSAFLRGGAGSYGVSSLIPKFPPNYARQLSVKSRRNCSNIGVAQVVAVTSSDDQGASFPASADKAVHAAAASAAVPVDIETGAGHGVLSAKDPSHDDGSVQKEDLPRSKYASFLKSDGSIAIHAGERVGRQIETDSITTPVVNTSAYYFKNTAELIDHKEKRRPSIEYGRYGNYTTAVAEEKISALEWAESTLLVASGMCVITATLTALVPAGGHLVTTTDCYRKTRIFIGKFLPERGITTTFIDPADIRALESALEKNKVSLFFTESPTNPFLRCIDIEQASKLCHDKGALVCVDGTFATPFNQKPLVLGADLVVHSATKYISGHNDVIAGSISGPAKLISIIRDSHHVLGGVLNPKAASDLINGMKTLHLRVRHQNSTAQRMAEILEAHPKIRRVYYPGLASHPDHVLAKKQMRGFGGVVSFEIDGDLHKTAKFIDSMRIPYIAASFGAVESLVNQPAIMSYWDLPQCERVAKYGILDNLVRFSFGAEELEDLEPDILQALHQI